MFIYGLFLGQFQEDSISRKTISAENYDVDWNNSAGWPIGTLDNLLQ